MVEPSPKNALDHESGGTLKLDDKDIYLGNRASEHRGLTWGLGPAE